MILYSLNPFNGLKLINTLNHYILYQFNVETSY